MRFSVIIPTYARPDNLRLCLSGLAGLEYPRDQFEAIVVDDGSPAALDSLIRPFESRLAVALHRQSRSGPSGARNLGARQARGEWLAFLDDDCVPEPNWLTQADAAASRSPAAMLGGFTTNACPENIFAEVNQILVSTVRSWLRDHASPLSFYPSNNLFLPSAAFQSLGGFDSECHLAGGEDRELCARWLATGGQMIDVPDARVMHYHPQTLSSFLKMHIRYGKGAAQLHRTRSTSPLQLASKGLHGSLLRATLHAPSRSSGAALAVLLAIAQSAEALGYAIETFAPGSSPAPLKTGSK